LLYCTESVMTQFKATVRFAPDIDWDGAPSHQAPGVEMIFAGRLWDRPALENSRTTDSPGALRSTSSFFSSGAAPGGLCAFGALDSYLRWGEDCPRHLEGEWILAVLDRRERKLFLARDQLGNLAVYVRQRGGLFSFATRPEGLPGPCGPLNEEYLARVLTAWPPDGVSTIFKDIELLQPGSVMTVTAPGVRTNRYWNLEDTPELVLPKREDYVEPFLDVYGQAVRRRIEAADSLCTTLSGGLDSGSATVVAARHLAGQGRRLRSFSFFPRFPVASLPPSSITDESPLIQATASHAGNIDVDWVRGERFTVMETIRRSARIHNAPTHAAGNMFWIYELLARAKEQGFDALMTGQGGNGSISWDGRTPSLKNLWRKRAWRTMAGELLARVAPGLYEAVLGLRQGPEPWSKYSAIHPDFVRRIRLDELMRAAGHDPHFRFRRITPRERRLRLIRPGAALLPALWAEISEEFGLWVTDPTRDRAVVEYCWSVPEWIWQGPNNEGRWLIREAMRGLLPPMVRDNQRRGVQTADLAARIRAEAPDVSQTLDEMRRSPLVNEYLSMPRVDQAWREVQSGDTPEAHSAAVTIVTRGIGAGLFLLQQPGGRA